jgi:hypothetical protein
MESYCGGDDEGRGVDLLPVAKGRCTRWATGQCCLGGRTGELLRRLGVWETKRTYFGGIFYLSCLLGIHELKFRSLVVVWWVEGQVMLEYM